MKILVVQDRLRSGGTERQTVFLANTFAAAGHATTLQTFRPGGPLDATVAPDVRRIVLQRRDLGLDWFAPGLYRNVEQLAPDIVLCMGRMANCWAHAIRNVLVDRWPKSAVVCTMRTGKQLPWLFRHSLRTCRHIVANSAEAREVLTTRYGLPAEKISVIRNALVFDVPHAPAARLRRRRDQAASPKTLVLLCVAMFRVEKNQRELIEIATGLPRDADWQLWLAGDGPARAECEQLAAKNGVADRVKFLGFQSDPSALYAAADVAVHTSWSESLSNFLIEAQAQGLPGVAYSAQGIRECFIPGQTGWEIAREDRDAFRAILLRLMAEPDEVRAARRHEAQTFARSAFHPQRQANAYLELFAELTTAPDQVARAS